MNVGYSKNLFKKTGFHGCIGSTYGTHVELEACTSWTSNEHKGFKLNKPSRNYNVTCNHSREMLH